MDPRHDADMMRFIDTGADGSELDLSEDGVSSLASSADLSFDLNSLTDSQHLDFGWMDETSPLEFGNNQFAALESQNEPYMGSESLRTAPYPASAYTSPPISQPNNAQPLYSLAAPPQQRNHHVYPAAYASNPPPPPINHPGPSFDLGTPPELGLDRPDSHPNGLVTHPADYVRRLESIAPSRAQTLLQKLKFGPPETLPSVKPPPHADILDVADQIHNEKLPYSVRLESFPLRSRVETQIKCRIVIQNKKTGFPPSHSLLHLPSDTIARPRFQLLNHEVLQQDLQLEPSVLYLSVDAINPDQINQQILMCGKCLERERRRAFRKKVMDPHEETYWTGLQDKRIVVFNCRQVMPISTSGHVELPLRVACYCRHHAAKNGYQLLFGVRDSRGNLLGRAISPRVFITDSHKDHRKHADPAASEAGVADSADSNSESEATFSNPSFASPNFHPPNFASPNLPNANLPNANLPTPNLPATNLPATNFVPTSFTPSSGADSAIESESESDVSSQHSRSSSMHRVSSNASVNRMHPYARPKPHHALANSAPLSRAVPSWLAAVPSEIAASPSPPAQVSRIIPPSGSVRGGVEITLLGQGFRPGLVAMFGDLMAVQTQFWSDTTIIAHLPPSGQPGPVPVTFQSDDDVAKSGAPLFTYIQDGEDKLKELTMQMIGYRMGNNFDEISGIVDRMSAETSARSPQTRSNGGHISGEQMALWALHNLPKIGGAQQLNVNLRNDEGQSMAHLAAMLGSAPVLHALMAKNAYLDLQDVSGYTPLHFAVLFDNRNVARLLLQADADPFNRTSHGLTARDLADGTVMDLLPQNQRAWYSELNRRGSSSSVASDCDDEGVLEHPLGLVPQSNTELSANQTKTTVSPYVSPLSTIGDKDIPETPKRPPPYSQLYPEVPTSLNAKVVGSPSSHVVRRRVIDIDQASVINEVDEENEFANDNRSLRPSKPSPGETRDPSQDLATKPRPAWMVRWANRDLDVRNDRMLFTFWIPVALVTIIAILMVYTLQHYGNPSAPSWVNAFGDLVGRGLNLAVDHVMPMPRVVPVAKTRPR